MRDDVLIPIRVPEDTFQDAVNADVAWQQAARSGDSPMFERKPKPSTPREEILHGRGLRPSSRALEHVLGQMTAGLLLKIGAAPRLQGVDRRTAAQIFTEASDHYGPGGATLREIACDIIALTGMPDPGNDPGRIHAAFSSATGTEILVAAVNTAFMTAYEAGEDTSAGWVAGRPLSNFKVNRRPRAGLTEGLAPVPRGGEAEHITIDIEGGEQYHAIRFGRAFIVDEQDAVSEDLASILEPAIVLGRAARRTKLDLIYSELLGNAALADGLALFHSNHANVSTGATLAASTLDVAIAAVANQTENNSPVNTVPRFLLVPPALLGLGNRLVADMTSDTEPPLRVRAEPRLSAGVTDPRTDSAHAGSATTWFLTCDSSVPTIEFGYRTEAPEVSKFDLKEGKWGFGFAISWDLGAKSLDHRGLHRATA